MNFQEFLIFRMVDPKRLKTTKNGGKKKGAAKQALKKKQLLYKYKNDDLRQALDHQAQSLYPVRPDSSSCIFDRDA